MSQRWTAWEGKLSRGVWGTGWRAGWVWLAAIVSVLFAPVVLAQDARPELNRVEIGWNWAIPTGRWIPVRVWLEGGPDSSQGVVRVTYQADHTQMAEVRVLASTTPNKLTPVDLVVCLPQDCGEVTVAYHSNLRRQPYVVKYRPPPDAGARQRRPEELGPMIGGSRGLIVHQGIMSLVRSMPKPESIDRSPAVDTMVIETTGATGDQLAELRWRQLAATDIGSAAFPTTPQAYEGLDALVLDARKAANLPPREREAVQTWIESGGRLVLIASDDDASWRTWIPDSSAGPMLTASPTAEMAVPKSVATVLNAQVLAIKLEKPTATNDGDYEGSYRSSTPTYTLESPKSVATRAKINARTFGLTDAGRDSGWKVSWATDLDRGLIAHGPVGLGMVTVLGVEPENIPDGLDTDATGRLWRDAMGPALGRYLATPMSGEDPGSFEQTRALNAIVTTPQLNDVVFHVILASLVGLALLMGPIDWFVLKRFRARQHSWMVAAGWIAIASVLAFVVPPRLRSGPPQINRLVTVDVVQAANDVRSPAKAWQSGLLGVFASGPTAIEFDREAVSGSWWKGVAAHDFRGSFRIGGSGRLRLFGPVVTDQVSTATRERENIPAAMTQPTWSYRTLADSSIPSKAPVRAAVERAGDEVIVHLSDLPPNEQIAKLSVRGLVGTTIEELPARFVRADGSAVSAGAEMPAAEAESQGYYSPSTGRWSARPHTSEGLWTTEIPGSQSRAAAFDARVASGLWYEVVVVLRSGIDSARVIPEALERRDGFESTFVTTVRIAVPAAGASGGTSESERPGSGKGKGQ